MNADELALCETFPATLRHEAETLIFRQPYRSRLSVLQGETVVSDGQPVFVLPFAAQLLGEYVLPIQFDVAVFFQKNAAALARFFADNPLYWQKQKNRIRSYWHCYHSSRYPDWQSYPVRLLAEEIDKEIARIVFRRPLTPNVV